jgi:acyl transferase domain-containing protein/NAD(P)-dependent dehydrogenase (short-subunit alcohol dehydrogenase family)
MNGMREEVERDTGSTADCRLSPAYDPYDPSPQVPVAIIGMGCLFPQAEGLARYWANIRTGVDAITDVPESHWSVADYFSSDPKAPDRTYAHRGGFLTPVEFPALEFGIAPNTIEATDTTQLLGLLVACQALDDAGYGGDRPLDRDRVSVILGVTGTLELVIPLGARLGHPIWRRALQAAGVDEQTTEDVVRRIADSYVGWQENSFPGLLGNVAAGRIANRLDLRGTNCVVDAACASSLGAVNLAILELATGRCDLAVTGGLDTFNDIFMYICFSKTPALSPTGEARPFDAEADGTILGEGLGVVVLKRLADARRDGDRVYAVIRSVGTSSDGKGQAVYAPSAAGQAQALRRAYATAGISPATVEMVEAHGTGTRVGDATELSALEEVFQGERVGNAWCALGSVKSQVGHTKAAAGAAGLIKAALALHHKVLPPTLKVRRPIESLARGHSPFYLNAEARPWLPNHDGPRRAAVSAFGFGGSNYHCVLEEAEPEKPGVDWDGDVQILAYSADEPGDVAEGLHTLDGLTDWPEIRIAAAESRARFRSDHRYRLLLVASRGPRTAEVGRLKAQPSDKAFQKSLQPFFEAFSLQPSAFSLQPFVGSGPRPGGLAFLFPGQGSQYVGMLHELACVFPQMQGALARMNRIARDEPCLLSDCVYPPATFDEQGRQAREVVLRDTRLAQPAIGAVSLGLLRILEDFGVRPELVGGHSFGELTALRAAGRIDDASLSTLAHRRGALMARCAAEGSGAMLAAFAPIGEVSDVIRERNLDVIIANKNAPRQCVLSGPALEIERCRQVLSDHRIATRAVPVSAAFHSRLVGGAEGPFRLALDAVNFRPSAIPVFANTTAEPYPDDTESSRDLLARQLACPVEFVAQVEAMYRTGARTFLEVGPHTKLTGLVGSILEGRAHLAIALDASLGSGGNIRDLAYSLATLASLGYAVDLNRWDEGGSVRTVPAKRPGLTVRISGANARPKERTSEGPERKSRSVLPQPERSERGAAVERTPRFALPQALDPTMPHPQSRPHAENARTMNPPQRIPSHHSNGQASSHALHPPQVLEEHEPPVRARPPVQDGPAPPSLAFAFLVAQENLASLQRLAEQTADLHRQFLEGQERTQQTFLKLLEHQQGLLRSLPDPAEAAAPPQIERAFAIPTASPASVSQPERSGFLTPEKPYDTEPSVVSNDPATTALIDVVAEKTGYPAEALDLDMQLDADLGIDSIKRVEILSALQERHPELPAPKPEQLGSFRTLRSIAEFMGRRTVEGPSGRWRPPSEDRAGTVGATHALTNDSETLAQALLETVAEKTGYPAEMLELDMRLDADLGIDSIKRVEILSALQDRFPGLPRVGPERIGILGTLRDIVGFLCDAGGRGRAHETLGLTDPNTHPGSVAPLRPPLAQEGFGVVYGCHRPDAISVTVCPEPPPPSPSQGGENWAQSGAVSSSISHTESWTEPRPVESPRSAGVSMARVSHAPSVTLRRLEPRAVHLASPEHREALRLPAGGTIWITDDGSALAHALRSLLLDRGYRPRVIPIPIEGVDLPEPDDRLCGLIVLAPVDRQDTIFVPAAFRTIRAASSALERSGERGGAALLTVSRLDGRFGIDGLARDINPASGALAGLAKTAGREWPRVHCKAVDLDVTFDSPEKTATVLVDELLMRGPAEVGLSRSGRVVLEMGPAPEPVATRGRTHPLGTGDLVVITGGARGITAEVAVALAESFQPRLLVLGRSPAPDADDDGFAGCHDEVEVKRLLLARSDRNGSPRAIAEQARQVIAMREIRRNLGRIAGAGSPAVYRSVDVRDQVAVRRTIAWARDEFGPVRGLIHGAGVLADRRIADQTDAQFEQVFETKVEGLNHLFEAIDPEALRFLALFSSSTARFGRSGQVAYAAANEYLNKWAQQASVRLPHCRVVSFNWGPWAGGMVTDTLRPMFENEGLTLILPESGAKLVVDEIGRSHHGRGPVEIVVLAEPATPADAHVPPMSKMVAAAALQKPQMAFRRRIDLETLPILADHVIDGHAVLPMAMILEWAAEGALHRNPGLILCGVDELRLFKGVILNGLEPATVEIRAAKGVRRGAELVVPVELRGTLDNGREIVHARADVILADRHPSGTRRLSDQALSRPQLAREEIYSDVLFHGAAMQGIERVDGCGDRGIAGWVATAPPPSEWLERPLRSQWLTDPLAIDCAFQFIVLWTREHLGANSLPTSVGRYRQFRPGFGEKGVRIVAEIRQANDARAMADIEILDAGGELVARLDSYECVVDSSLNQAFRRNQLIAPSPVVAS